MPIITPPVVVQNAMGIFIGKFFTNQTMLLERVREDAEHQTQGSRRDLVAIEKRHRAA